MEWNYYKIDYEYFHLGRLCIHSGCYSASPFCGFLLELYFSLLPFATYIHIRSNLELDYHEKEGLSVTM